jgi:hypothetical protein
MRLVNDYENVNYVNQPLVARYYFLFTIGDFSSSMSFKKYDGCVCFFLIIHTEKARVTTKF